MTQPTGAPVFSTSSSFPVSGTGGSPIQTSSSLSFSSSLQSAGAEEGCISKGWNWVCSTVSSIWEWLKSWFCDTSIPSFAEPCPSAVGKQIEDVVERCFRKEADGRVIDHEHPLDVKKSYEGLIIYKNCQHAFSIQEGKVSSLAPFLESLCKTREQVDFSSNTATLKFIERVEEGKWRLHTTKYYIRSLCAIESLSSKIVSRQEFLKDAQNLQQAEREFLKKAGVFDPSIEEPNAAHPSSKETKIDFPSKTQSPQYKVTVQDID